MFSASEFHPYIPRAQRHGATTIPGVHGFLAHLPSISPKINGPPLEFHMENNMFPINITIITASPLNKTMCHHVSSCVIMCHQLADA